MTQAGTLSFVAPELDAWHDEGVQCSSRTLPTLRVCVAREAQVDAPRHRSVCVAMEGGRHHPGRDAGLRSRSRSPVVQPVVAPVLRRQAVVAPVLRRQPVFSQTEPLKLVARVYAESAISGLVSTTFTLTSNTPLGKLMTTWCARQNVDSSDACFMKGKVEIQHDHRRERPVAVPILWRSGHPRNSPT